MRIRPPRIVMIACISSTCRCRLSNSVDLERHLGQAACAQAVEHLRETTEFVRILGSYQQGDTIEDSG